jgi:hypothetical protein
MTIQSNKKTTTKGSQKSNLVIDETVKVTPEVVTEIDQLVGQELMLIEQPFELEAVGQLVDEVVGQEETDQPKLTYEQLMAIIEQQANSIEELKSNQPKQNQPINGGVLNTNGNSKADQCRLIWNEEVANNKGGCPVRSVTIKRFIKECGLTEKGAPTYYQNMKKAAGFVVSK